MIKGKLGFKWRGATLISAGVAVPILYVALAGGPGSQKTTEPDDGRAPPTVTLAPAPTRAPTATPTPAPASPPSAGAPAKCDPFSSMHGCAQDDRKPDLKALPDDDDGH
jgi:hypothetical protein